MTELRRSRYPVKGLKGTYFLISENIGDVAEDLGLFFFYIFGHDKGVGEGVG